MFDGSLLVLRTHLVGPGAGQTARQRAAVGRQSGGERRAAVRQNGFKVTEHLLKGMNTAVEQLLMFHFLMEGPPESKKKQHL